MIFLKENKGVINNKQQEIPVLTEKNNKFHLTYTKNDYAKKSLVSSITSLPKTFTLSDIRLSVSFFSLAITFNDIAPMRTFLEEPGESFGSMYWLISTSALKIIQIS